MSARLHFKIGSIGFARNIDVTQLAVELPCRREFAGDAVIYAQIGLIEFIFAGDWRLPGIGLRPDAELSRGGDLSRRLGIADLQAIGNWSAPVYVLQRCFMDEKSQRLTLRVL